MPNLEPHAAPLSYLQAGAHLIESVSSNVQNSLGGSSTSTISDALGSLELQRLWSNYDLSLDYLGGVGYYNASGIGLKQIEELGVNQKITWKRGELGIRDAFSYQPEGTFGSAYGSVGTIGAGLGGQSAFFGGTGLGALGQVPRIMNLSLVDVVENLTPKSSVTATGGYGFVHFLGNEPGTGTSFIGNSQVSAEVGYNRLLGPHDQGATGVRVSGIHLLHRRFLSQPRYPVDVGASDFWAHGFPDRRRTAVHADQQRAYSREQPNFRGHGPTLPIRGHINKSGA